DLTATVPLNAASLALVDAVMSSGQDIDGVMPILEARVPVVNDDRQLAEPDVILTGLDPARIDAYGGLKTTSGRTMDLAALAPDDVVVTAKLAGDINARVGDTLSVFIDGVPRSVTVSAIADDSYLAGALRSRG